MLFCQKALDDLERRRQREMEMFKRVCLIFLLSQPPINNFFVLRF